jgi:hypothetical protein
MARPQNSVVTILYTNGFCHVDLGNTSKVQSGPPVCGVEVPVGPYLPPHALLTITFKGRMTHADNDRWCTTPGRLARKARRPCTSSSWSRCSRRRLSMEPRWTTKKVVHWLPSRPITAGREVLPAIARHLKCSSSTRARRRGERPTQTARALGPRTVCSCPSVSLGNTSAFGEA